MNLKAFLKTACFACLLPASLLFSADDPSPAIRRPSLGFRIEGYANRLFTTSSSETVTTKPVANTTYTGSTPSPKGDPATLVGVPLKKAFSAGVGLSHQQSKKQKKTKNNRGGKEPKS